MCSDGTLTWSSVFLAPVVSDNLWTEISDLHDGSCGSSGGATTLVIPDFGVGTARRFLELLTVGECAATPGQVGELEELLLALGAKGDLRSDILGANLQGAEKDTLRCERVWSLSSGEETSLATANSDETLKNGGSDVDSDQVEVTEDIVSENDSSRCSKSCDRLEMGQQLQHQVEHAEQRPQQQQKEEHEKHEKQQEKEIHLLQQGNEVHLQEQHLLRHHMEEKHRQQAQRQVLQRRRAVKVKFSAASNEKEEISDLLRRKRRQSRPLYLRRESLHCPHPQCPAEADSRSLLRRHLAKAHYWRRIMRSCAQTQAPEEGQRELIEDRLYHRCPECREKFRCFFNHLRKFSPNSFTLL